MLSVVMRPAKGAQVHRVFIDQPPPRAGLHRKKFGGQRPDGRLILYDDPKLAEARDYWQTGILQSGKKNLSLTGTLGLRLVLVFPQSTKTLRGKVGSYWLKGTAPDCSNLLKVCEDVLQQMGVVANDAQIASVSVTKMTGPRPCALVELMELDGHAEVAFAPEAGK